jgi:hypothetical protein
MKESFSKEQNKKKYLNSSGEDLIDIWSKIDERLAISFCIQNIHKMTKRYISEADKAQNPSDILKALDYANRALILNKDNKNIKRIILLLSRKKLDYQRIETNCLRILNEQVRR